MDQDYYDRCWERTFAPEEDAEEKEADAQDGCGRCIQRKSWRPRSQASGQYASHRDTPAWRHRG